ncbi:MutS-related protein [Pseudobacteroides cellulosolvens]|uniref:DNA mismatch repair protein MutS domain protein n=1 Tax=Pseudobacteroides cellulosolvens ATCC 35603 = DSM 2933 TaxID=398512 RepID=A0A0L6JT43_9FIRM|nr:DNA mismatch repair protein MutS [Pseudobacteroides cellulosolvens]KNY28869.1 DNA mismatch repair protein MutS domain protein [Pseudobacteroides cellulosolvens ATCC 35603 = DSM 2933]
MVNKVSLLYCNSNEKLHLRSEMPEFIKDLQLDKIIDIMCAGSKNQNCRRIITSVFTELCQNSEDIDYRYDILQDFIQSPHLVEDLEVLFSRLDSVERDRQASIRVKNRVSAEYKLIKDIVAFLEYCEIYKKLAAALNCYRGKYMSPGLKKFCATVCEYAAGNNFAELQKTLLTLKQCLKGYMRLKLEVRLDTSFKLIEALLVDIDSNGFGSDCIDKEEYAYGSWAQRLKKLFSIGSKYSDTQIIRHIDYILEQNVNEVKDKVLTSISSILEAMAASASSFLRNLSEELLFYEGALKLVNKMHRFGLAASRAVIAPAGERSIYVQGVYDLSFAFYLADSGCEKPMEVIVSNKVCLDDEGRIQIITGPNQGGKTTYIRAAGILQVLAQAGIPVPAAKAAVSPVDCLFTHFPADEKPESNEGRLGEELDRMLFILENATPKSLVLMNESFASTNSREGSAIAEDILSALAVIGARCAFVTHLYELAERVDSINKDIQAIREGSSRLVSMAAQFQEGDRSLEADNQKSIRRRTYRIVAGPPAKSSFAADIAEQFGIRCRSDVSEAL